MLPRIVIKDSRLQVFQYKLLNNVLYLNKMLFRFGKIDSPLCSFCKMIEETPLHLFYNCIKTKLLWDQLKDFISTETLSFPSLTPQNFFFAKLFLKEWETCVWLCFFWFSQRVFPLQHFWAWTSKLFLRVEAVVRGCSVKKVLLEISQNSQKNTCARVSFQ